MKSKARREIEKWVKTNVRNPVYIGEGQVFLWPSGFQRHENYPQHYLVVWMQRQTPKAIYNEFACACRGYFLSQEDECRHIRELKTQIHERGKGVIPSGKASP